MTRTSAVSRLQSSATRVWGGGGGSSAHLVVEVVQVPGQDATDAVHLLWEEGPAVGPRVHADKENRRTQRLTQGQLCTFLLEIYLKYLVCLFVLAA